MRIRWIVAAAIGVLAAMPAMASDTCLDGDTACKQTGSGGRSGSQMGSGYRVASETCLDTDLTCKQGGSGGRQSGSGGRIASTDETCTGDTCLEGGWAGGGGRQHGSGGRSDIQDITWSRFNGFDGSVMIAATIRFADGTSATIAFEE
jgi:hypothetical protein